MADRNGYIGRAPGDSAVIVARQTFQPTGVQTDFTFSSGYDPGYLDVYLNGSRLIVASDYTATDGSAVGLTSYADNGDVLECVAYKAFNLGSVNNAAGNFTVAGDLTVEGTTTLAAGSSVSYATTAFNLESGVWTNTDTTAATNTTTGALIVSGGVGIAKSLFVGGNISAGGTVAYEDVTNVDSVGIITAGKGFRATTGGIIVTAGVVTATDGVQYGSAGAGGSITAAGDAVFAGIVTVTGNSFVGSAITMYASAGIVSATSFYGDGSNLEGVSSSGGAVLDITACLFI